MPELASTYRVYRKEWLFEGRYPDEASAVLRCQEEYGGRLHKGDMRIEADDHGWVLSLRRWNVIGEWKRLPDAERQASESEGEIRIVGRNSRAEHLLVSYGKLKIAT